MTGGSRKRRNDDRQFGFNESDFTTAVAMLVIGGSVATAVTGSWLPGVGTLAALLMMAEFSRRYNSREK